jgi:hypothetical protein
MVSSEKLPPVGLCEDCRFAATVKNERGSVFFLCELSRSNTRFARYPRLPVLVCPGFGAREAGSPQSDPPAFA